MKADFSINIEQQPLNMRHKAKLKILIKNLFNTTHQPSYNELPPSEFSTVITCEILCQVGKGSHQAFLNPIPYVFTKQKKSYLTIYSQPILPLFY